MNVTLTKEEYGKLKNGEKLEKGGKAGWETCNNRRKGGQRNRVHRRGET